MVIRANDVELLMMEVFNHFRAFGLRGWELIGIGISVSYAVFVFLAVEGAKGVRLVAQEVLEIGAVL